METSSTLEAWNMTFIIEINKSTVTGVARSKNRH